MAMDRQDDRTDPRFEPVHDGSYDKIVRPDIELRVPGYFLRNWGPKLSPGAALLYLHLRLMCWYDTKNPQNSRDYCWPKQTTLARLIGSSRRSVQRHLKELEEHELIRRKPTYHYDQEKGKKVRGVDVYQVPYRVPLVTDDHGKAAVIDAEEILSQSHSIDEKQQLSPRRQDDAQVNEAPPGPKRQIDAQVSYPRPKRQIVVGTAAPNCHTEVIPEAVNVNNVRGAKTGRTKKSRQAEHLLPQEKTKRDAMAAEIGEQLKRMCHDRSPDPHKSAGFHRRIASMMPEHLIREAIAATRDAVEDQRSGRKELHVGVAPYFAGIVRRIAEREQIDLGVDWSPKQAIESR